LFAGVEMLLHDLARGPRRERIAFRRQVSARNRLRDGSRVINVDRRDCSGQTNAFESATHGGRARSRRDRDGTRRSRSHSIDREHVADSVDYRDRRIDAARLRFRNRLRDDLLNVGNRQARGRAAARTTAATRLVGAGGRGNRITAGARGDQSHDPQQ
jgi:hypothetical protein